MRDKFRAIIDDNTTIVFTLRDLLENKFSNRELLWPWLKEHDPDRYTGLNDADGVPIFEGDILSLRTARRTIVSPVMFVKHRAQFALDSTLTVGPEIQYWQVNAKVIGNIHQHPHLLD